MPSENSPVNTAVATVPRRGEARNNIPHLHVARRLRLKARQE